MYKFRDVFHRINRDKFFCINVKFILFVIFIILYHKLLMIMMIILYRDLLKLLFDRRLVVFFWYIENCYCFRCSQKRSLVLINMCIYNRKIDLEYWNDSIGKSDVWSIHINKTTQAVVCLEKVWMTVVDRCWHSRRSFFPT